MIASDFQRRSLTPSQDSQSLSKTHLHALVTQDALTRGYFLDPKARELETYMLTLQSYLSWETLISQDSVLIETLPESKYSDEVPVYRVQVHLSANVKPAFALSMIDNPDFRTQWDLTTREMTVIYVAEENSYVRNYIQRQDPPLDERELLEKCQVREVGEELRMVFYSAVDPVPAMQEFPPKVLVTRAFTHFGMVQFFPSGSKTLMRLTHQTNLYQHVPVLDATLTSLMDWILRFREVVEAHSSS